MYNKQYKYINKKTFKDVLTEIHIDLHVVASKSWSSLTHAKFKIKS